MPASPGAEHRQHWQLFPSYSRWERIADLAIHIAGVTCAVVGIAILAAIALPSAGAREAVSVALYGVGLIAMLSLSALYNLLPAGPAKAVLRRFDHAAIFVMIAGSYTPFVLVGLDDGEGLPLLAVVWALALFGVVLKLTWPRRSDGLALVLYLAMGWSVLFELRPLSEAVSTGVLVLLLVGGVVYTLGVPFHLCRRLRFQNAIWHAFVLGGASCHYAAIVQAVSAA